MANLTRPPLRASVERLARGRHPKSPTSDKSENVSLPSTTLSTRRSSRNAPLVALDDKKPTKALSQRKSQSTPSRTNPRKRPASELASDAPIEHPKPPTKVTVTQPHGRLVQTINGVQTTLAIGDDDVPSGISTPKTNGVASGLTVPPAGTQGGQDKRSLRSQDGGSRLKSDLSIYFSNYEDIIEDVPKPPELLSLDTPIYIVDEPIRSTKSRATTSPSPTRSRKSTSPALSRKSKAASPARDALPIPSSQSSTTYQALDYSTIARHLRSDNGEDPLADSVYFASHRRAERKEKQLRNIEKERAMHEKVQLERLLDGLQGHDWLKVMGITGVTDGERKDWEPKRAYFVKEVQTLVDKFRIWKEEEKRLRAEKEAALHAREDEGDEDEEDEAQTESDIANTNSAEGLMPPRPSTPKPRRPPRPHGYFLPVLPPQPTSPFTSFYAKSHLREAALGKHRHGRKATAFGQPIPEFEEHEFELPEEYTTTEALRDHARKRRRQKRENVPTKKGG